MHVRLMAKIPIVLAVIAVIVVMLISVQEADAERILMAEPIGSRSHTIFFTAIAESLAQRNHTVTLVTSFKSTRQRPNIREIFVPDANIADDIPNLFNNSAIKITWKLFPKMVTLCSQALGASEVQAAVKEGFDLVMLHAYVTDCFLSIAHTMKVPFIYVSPLALQGSMSDLAGNPYFPSLQPPITSELDYPLTFLDRMTSTLMHFLDGAYTKYIYLPKLEADCRTRRLCPQDMPSLTELRLNGSLFITNSVKMMENPTLPYTPTVVHAGGIHCRSAKPLPEDLQQWVAGAGKPGVILFSLGSLIKSSAFPEEYKRVMLEVFGSLPQRVLWKWDEDTMEGLPSNVLLSKWLPQQDILGHPQLRLFITHGGLLSTQEATYHGVPVLGMPVALDQRRNMKRIEREGWGRLLHWEDLTYDSFRNLILQMMGDSRLQEKAQQLAKIMQDQPVSPREWTSYWIEYVLRHNGARHLRCPGLDIPWYKLYNVDVWAVVVGVVVVATGVASWLSYRMLCALLVCCCRSRKAKKD